MTEQQRQISPTYILRGPIVTVGALASFATPYVVRLSPHALLHMTIIIVSMLCFCWDLLKCMERQSRISIEKILNSLVLDDLLRTIYDPEDGILACMVGGFVGASTIYGLRLKEHDKTRLVQATLGIDYEQAYTLLLAPGGCKVWLPTGMQQWLNQSKPSQSTVKAIQDGDYNSVDETDGEDETYCSRSIPASPIPREPLKKSSDGDSSSNDGDRARGIAAFASTNPAGFASMPQRPSIGPMDPVEEMVNIMRRLVYSQAKPYVQSIPETLLKNVGLSAVALLGTHLHYRRNNRRQKHSTLGMVGNLLLAGIASGAISTVVAKRMILQGHSFSKVCHEMVKRSWQSIKDRALVNNKWRSYLAMVVLLMLGRRRQNSGTGARSFSRR